MGNVQAGGRIPLLYFSNEEVRGGVEEHILTLLRGLDRERFRPYLACTPALTKALANDLPSDVELFPIFLRGSGSAPAAWRLARWIRRHKIRILHSHLFYASLYASPIGWLCRVPVIVETPHVRESWRSGWKSGYWIDRMAGRFVTHYIAVSDANAAYLVQEKGLPKRKVVTIHNGSDLSRFDPARRPAAGLRERMQIGADDPVVVVAARLEPQKGHHVLLEAMPAILASFPSTKVVCVGDGSLRSELEAKAQALGVAGAMRFAGFQSNVQDWLALADMTVLPSYYEGLPLAAIESLAAGRPVVATAVDGTPEVVVNQMTGLTVPPGQPQPLAAAVCRMLGDPEMRANMSAGGRDWVVRRFSRERQIRATEDFYLSACECRRSSDTRQYAPALNSASRRG